MRVYGAILCLLAVGIGGATVAGYASGRASPARRPGGPPGFSRFLCADSPAATAAATDPLLGFSRYLPPGIDHYVSLLQAGRVWRTVSGSRAALQLAGTPEVKTFLDELRRELDLTKLPPDAERALGLLGEAFDSEITLALPSETMSGAVDLVQAFALGALLLVPAPYPPESPEGRLLAAKRKPFREAWVKSLEAMQVPSVILAARMKRGGEGGPWLEEMLAQGRRGFLEAVVRDSPPEVRKALEGAWTEESVGGVSLHRFRLRVKDLFTPDMVDQAFLVLPASDEDRTLLARAVRGLTVDVHVGFLGEYLVAVVAPDDRLIRQIVDRFEGRSGETLAASAPFERIRAALTPDAIGITYSDGRRSWAKFNALMGLARQALDPQLLLLLGAPQEMLMTVDRLRKNLEAQSGTCATCVEGVDTLDRGIRGFRRTAYEPKPVPVTPGPLSTLGGVPDGAVGYHAVRDASWDDLWALVKDVFDQQAALMAPLKAQAADNPAMAAAIRQQEAMAKRILGPIQGKLAPALRGEMTFVLGDAVPLAVSAAPEMQGIQIPSAAMIATVAEPQAVIAGFRDLVRGVAETLVESQREGGGGGIAPMPLVLMPREVDGQTVHVLFVPGIRIEGFEPHLACVGQTLVLSSSFALTRRIRDAAEGRAPRIVASAAHRAMDGVLDPKAWEASFVDGARVNVLLRSLADGIFSVVERQMARSPDSERTQLESVKVFVRNAIAFLGCFRGHAASVVREGDADVQREWAHFADLEPK